MDSRVFVVMVCRVVVVLLINLLSFRFRGNGDNVETISGLIIG